MEVIGVCGICNTASLNLYEVDTWNDKVKAGINNLKPRMYKLYCNSKGMYFNFGGSRVFLSDFVRINW